MVEDNSIPAGPGQILPRTPQTAKRYAFNPDMGIKLIELAEVVMVMGLKIGDDTFADLSPGAQRHFVPLAPVMPKSNIVGRPKLITPNTK